MKQFRNRAYGVAGQVVAQTGHAAIVHSIRPGPSRMVWSPLETVDYLAATIAHCAGIWTAGAAAAETAAETAAVGAAGTAAAAGTGVSTTLLDAPVNAHAAATDGGQHAMPGSAQAAEFVGM